MSGIGGLYRSRRHRIIAGVAGGMAERFGLPIFLVRLLWLLLLLPGGLIRAKIARCVGVPVGEPWMFSESTMRLSISMR